MQINFVYDPSVASAPSGFVNALNEAASIISQNILNPETVTINIGWGKVPGGDTLTDGTLAAAGPTGDFVSYDQLINDLFSNPNPSFDDIIFLLNTPLTNPLPGHQWFISTAEEKALGIKPAFTNEVDGVLGVNASQPWDFTQSNTIQSGQFDLVGTLLHEITHALGRVTDTTDGFPTVESLTRFNNAGQLSVLDPPPHANFSMDGGFSFLTGFSDISDFGDFDGTDPNDSFNAFLSPGKFYHWINTDSLMMQALGFQTLGQDSFFAHQNILTDFTLPGVDTMARLGQWETAFGSNATVWSAYWETQPLVAMAGSAGST